MKKRNLDLELSLAVIKPDPDKVEQLLAEGADPNAVGDRRYARIAHRTSLWLAVSNAGEETSKAWGDLYAAVSELIPSIPERDHSAVRQKFIEIAHKLLAANVDLEIHSFGITPLRIAVHHRDLEMVKLLLAKKANPNAETYSPLSRLAKTERRKGPVGLMGYFSTALHEAVEKNSPEIVKALLDAGADLARPDHEGKTPFDIARDRGNAEIVELISKVLGRKSDP